MQVKQFVSDHVGMLLIFAVVLGLLVQPLAAVFYPLITPIIIILIALGFIKLDFSLLMQECRNWPIQLYLLLFGLIATPVLLYVLIDNAAYYISTWVVSSDPIFIDEDKPLKQMVFLLENPCLL